MIVYLGIGSNIKPGQNIAAAIKTLGSVYPGANFSRVFESAAVGFEGDDFQNLVAQIETDQSLEATIEQIKQLENELGRQRGGEKFSSRHIDIDILLFGDKICQQPIELPRSEIRENAYVLWPLAELAPDLKEPGGEQTYAELWAAFDKTLQIIKPVSE